MNCAYEKFYASSPSGQGGGGGGRMIILMIRIISFRHIYVLYYKYPNNEHKSTVPQLFFCLYGLKKSGHEMLYRTNVAKCRLNVSVSSIFTSPFRLVCGSMYHGGVAIRGARPWSDLRRTFDLQKQMIKPIVIF